MFDKREKIKEGRKLSSLRKVMRERGRIFPCWSLYEGMREFI